MTTTRGWICAFIAVWVVASIPLLCTEVLPLLDYPSHLTRVHLLANWNQLPPTFGEFYQPQWAILPNLALEAIAVPLAKLLPATIALRLFCIFIFGLLIWGCAELHHATTGKLTIWSLAPALLVYNFIFSFGFLNFLFGLGLFFVALSWHIKGRDERLQTRLIRELLFCSVLFFSHLIALFLYLLSASVVDFLFHVRDSRSWRSLLSACSSMVPALLVVGALLLLSPTRHEVTRVLYQRPASKMIWLLIFQTGQGYWDIFFAVALVAFISTLLLLEVARLNPLMGVLSAMLAFVFIVAPFSFGSAQHVDTRIPIVVLFIVFAGLELKKNSLPVFAVLMMLFAFRVTTEAVHFAKWNDEYQTLRADLRIIPVNSLIFMLPENGRIWWPDEWDPPLAHGSELLLLEKPVFAATVFTLSTQQPLRTTEPVRRLQELENFDSASVPQLGSFGRIIEARLDREQASKTYLYYVKTSENTLVVPEFEILVDRSRYSIYRLGRHSDKPY